MKKVSKGTPLRKNAWIMTFSCEEEKEHCDDVGYGYYHWRQAGWAEANFLWVARLNKKNEIMKILPILEIFTK